MNSKQKVRNGTVIALGLLGIWLAFSSTLLMMRGTTHMLNAIVTGLLVIGLAFAAQKRVPLAFQGAALLGAWTYISPWMLASNSALVTINNMIIGTATFAFAIAAIGALPPQPILRHAHVRH